MVTELLRVDNFGKYSLEKSPLDGFGVDLMGELNCSWQVLQKSMNPSKFKFEGYTTQRTLFSLLSFAGIILNTRLIIQNV